MAIGLGVLRSVGQRAGRAEGTRSPGRETVREVCLIGLDRRASGGDWPAGREVTWLGRRYQVRASAGEPSGASPASEGGDPGPGERTSRRYVHLGPVGGG